MFISKQSDGKNDPISSEIWPLLEHWTHSPNILVSLFQHISYEQFLLFVEAFCSVLFGFRHFSHAACNKTRGTEYKDPQCRLHLNTTSPDNVSKEFMRALNRLWITCITSIDCQSKRPPCTFLFWIVKGLAWATPVGLCSVSSRMCKTNCRWH